MFVVRVQYIFWLVLLPLFVASQNDSKSRERKLFFSTLFNSGLFYTTMSELVKYEDAYIKQDLKRTYTNGFSVNLSLGVSYLLSRKWSMETYFGVNRSKYGRTEIGLTEYKMGSLPYKFYGTKNYTFINKGFSFTSGVTFHNPMLLRLKIYFSNYLNYNWVLRTTELLSSKDELQNSSFKSQFTSLAPKSIFYSTHLVSLKVNVSARMNVKPAIGFNFYINNHYKQYINPIINLTITI